MNAHTYFDEMQSPVGPITVMSDGDCLTAVYFDLHRHRPAQVEYWKRDPALGVLQEAREQLEAYFARERTDFDLPLRWKGTPFQVEVWQALLNIGYGKVSTYGELAREIGRPLAVRAVGLANGRNPLSIVVPCHRVIGANGTLTGYGGGLPRKRWLLDHEGASSGATLALAL